MRTQEPRIGRLLAGLAILVVVLLAHGLSVALQDLPSTVEETNCDKRWTADARYVSPCDEGDTSRPRPRPGDQE